MTTIVIAVLGIVLFLMMPLIVIGAAFGYWIGGVIGALIGGMIGAILTGGFS